MGFNSGFKGLKDKHGGHLLLPIATTMVHNKQTQGLKMEH